MAWDTVPRMEEEEMSLAHPSAGGPAGRGQRDNGMLGWTVAPADNWGYQIPLRP